MLVICCRLSLSLPFLSFLFSLEPFCVPPSSFFWQSSFYPGSVWCPPVYSAFHHPACSQETVVALGRPTVSLITYVTCSRHVLASGRGKHVHCKSVFTAGKWRGKMLMPLQALSKLLAHTRSHCLPSTKWPTMAGNHACNSEPRCWEMRCLWWVTCCEQRHFIQCTLGWHSGPCDAIQLPFTGETWQMMECDMGRFVDSWHTKSETDDTWWNTPPQATGQCEMPNSEENHLSRYSQFNDCAYF